MKMPVFLTGFAVRAEFLAVGDQPVSAQISDCLSIYYIPSHFY